MKNAKIRGEVIRRSILNSSEVIQNSTYLVPEIERTINEITRCLKKNNKIVIFGNGGSAADAQHIAAELIGRYQKERKSYPAIALTSNSSSITALANDYSFERVFSRQCESLVSRGDIAIGISTSGNSKNVKNGLISAKKKGAITIGLLGNRGGNIKSITDISIVVDSKSTPRIQEAHRTIYHIICEMVENNLTSRKKS